MLFKKSLEIDQEHYENTKSVLIKNGASVSEQTHGSRKILIADGSICGFSETRYYIPLSENITKSQFNSFLGAFTKSLYNQIKKNNDLLSLQIDFDGVSRDKNPAAWKKIKSKEIFYNVDLSSAYWQMAFRLNYISKNLYESYMFRDEFKEAKRYCVSFLARENEMNYFDGREIARVTCDISALERIYGNIRNSLYNSIDELKQISSTWVEYNIDGISVSAKELQKICEALDKMNLIYKVNECIKIDKFEYYQKGKIRKF
jgi:peptide methionine sulfoxide reductase MsrB